MVTLVSKTQMAVNCTGEVKEVTGTFKEEKGKR